MVSGHRPAARPETIHTGAIRAGATTYCIDAVLSRLATRTDRSACSLRCSPKHASADTKYPARMSSDWVERTLDAPAVPGLRVLVTEGRRWVLQQEDRSVLLGRAHPRFQGCDVARGETYISPLPPLRADDARRRAALPSGGLPSWASTFWQKLVSGAGPLHEGRWVLEPAPYRLLGQASPPQPVVMADIGRQGTYLAWWGPAPLVPLRQLSRPDGDRVKAYRRLVRESALPPVLTWWVGPLAGYVVLDGHDRLAAAIAEGAEPTFLELSLRMDVDGPLLQLVTDDYEKRSLLVEEEIARGSAGAEAALGGLWQEYATAVGRLARGTGRTRGWLLAGGAPEWRRLVDATAGSDVLVG